MVTCDIYIRFFQAEIINNILQVKTNNNFYFKDWAFLSGARLRCDDSHHCFFACAIETHRVRPNCMNKNLLISATLSDQMKIAREIEQITTNQTE